jgi:predicted DNA-binding transcriptional regulator YafY
MAKKSAPIQEVARLLDLVPYISTHSHISLKELALEFGVTEKAMADELTALSMCGLPGYTPYELIEVYFDSGFVTINNHDTLDIPRALTNVEASSLLIGLGLLRESAHGEDRLVSAIDSLIEKLRSVVDPFVEFENVGDGAEIALIQRAIAERRRLTFEYLSPVKDVVETREVEPVSVYSENGKIYLGAFSTSANAFRNFRVDRISGLAVGESVSGTIPKQGSDEVPRHEVHLRVLGRKRAISEGLSLQELPSDGEFVYRSYSSRWVERAVIAFSPDLVIESPADSRIRVRDEAEKILALYRS